VGFSVSHQSAGNNCWKLVKRKKLVFCSIQSNEREREREREREMEIDWWSFASGGNLKLPGKRMGVCKGFCGCVRETLSAAAQQAGGALRREAGKDFWREFGSQRFHVHESCVSRKTLLRLELVPASKEGRKEGRNLC